MPFRIALSGLNAASSELRVIGNNVANASTTGFKESRAEFADIFAASNLGVTANAIGSGVRVSSVSQQFTQGNIGFTDNNLDLAISGQGFFILNDNGVNAYTRAGGFGVDRDGYVVNSQAQRLTVFQADASGTITGATGDLRLDRSDIPPQATTAVAVAANLDSSDAVAGAITSTSFTVPATTQLSSADAVGTVATTPSFTLIDNAGLQHNDIAIRYTKTGATTWDVELIETTGGSTVTTSPVSIDTAALAPSVTLDWDPDGTGGQPSVPLLVDTSGITDAATAVAAPVDADGGQLAFDATDAATYNNSTSLTIYDSLGTAHLATMYFRKTSTPNIWEVYSFVDGIQQAGPDTLAFTPTGTIDTTVVTGPLTVGPFDPGTGAANLTYTVDFDDLTQYGSGFNVNNLGQDGFTTGRLSGIDISDSGIITSRFTNGQSRTLGQVALANFNNSQGLRQLGDTAWSETFDSGPPIVGEPATGSLGLIESGALEGSNVDLTEQLVAMITAQRNFQANAQVITTADTVTQTIINIR